MLYFELNPSIIEIEMRDDPMKKCTLCGHIMIDNEKVCSRCGFKITEYSGAEESKIAGYETKEAKPFDLESEKEKIVNKIERALPNDYRKYDPAMKFFLGLLFAPAFFITQPRTPATLVVEMNWLFDIFTMI